MRLPHFAAAALLSTSLVTHADTLMDFSNLSGTDGSTFTSYTESGFTAASISGTFYNATTSAGGGYIGNPLPSIYTHGPATLGVTDGGANFTFQSLDLASFDGGQIDYTMTGLLGGSTVFTQTGTLTTGAGDFVTLSGAYTGDNINSLAISLGASDAENLDNIVLSTAATPEPSSIALLGTGVLGIAGVVRKRLA